MTRNATSIAWLLASALCVFPLCADSLDFRVFDDAKSYAGVLLQQGRVQLDSDWTEPMVIRQNQVFDIFSFQFDAGTVQPVVAPGIVSGLGLGAEPNGTLGGGQGVSLVVSPGLAINAFGAEIVYAPFNGTVAKDSFRLVVDCPNPPCAFAGNTEDLDRRGGSFFLGVVADPGVDFNGVTLEALIPTDSSLNPAGIVPAWQVGPITFSPVPEPSAGSLLAAGLCGLAFLCRRAVRRI
jgi:hypothetical protein